MIHVSIDHFTGLRVSYEFADLGAALDFAWRAYRRLSMLRSISDGVDAVIE